MNLMLEALSHLAGQWVAEIRWSEETHKLVGGPRSVRAPVSFRWIEDGCFLVHDLGDETSPAPRSIIALMKVRQFAVLYADARKISRVYEMTLRDGIRKIQREAPGFTSGSAAISAQIGRPSRLAGEKSSDGTGWEARLRHDLDQGAPITSEADFKCLPASQGKSLNAVGRNEAK